MVVSLLGPSQLVIISTLHLSILASPTLAYPMIVSRPCCYFVVTSFGPFNEVPDNPMSVLIRHLRDDDSTTLNSRHLIHETHILETLAECVSEELNNIYGQLRKPSGEAGVNSNENSVE